MIQTPISNISTNRRYLSIFFIVATILLLLATVHISRDGVPEVIKSSPAWNNGGASDPPAQAPKPGHYYSGKHDNRPSFAELAANSGTDKVTDHNYAVLYDKYLPAFRDTDVKMLEIGLGCGMRYGPGASYETWVKYFPQVEMNLIEFDGTCATDWGSKHPKANVFIGDQSNAPFLHEVGREVTADRLVDILVDDGGHTMAQQRTSLVELWQYVRPGGIYIVEDLHTSYLSGWGGDPTKTDHGLARQTTMQFIYELLDDIMSQPAYNYHFEDIPAAKYAFSSEISSIDCMEAMCVLTKKEIGAR
ncbi:hard-surface induced protein [Colletotrichum sojae]|uniref:Hard-surface induced protein n=1 Tax=Colletotrichum sojae TaxID=2175907 RepID=A0A8H6J993_9PEZI|nr:hard-surface induced protein [Colletotrichum sojae]